MQNPFKFGGKVSGYQFYDRKESFAKLRRRLLDGASNIVMAAPRRYGKTSLVARVLESLQREEGIRSILFDLSKVPTLARFCEEYVNAVLAAIGGAEAQVHRVLACLANCDPAISVNVGVLRISLKFKSALTESSISEVLDLPEKLLEEGNGGSLVVAFDEFQEVAELSKDFALERSSGAASSLISMFAMFSLARRRIFSNGCLPTSRVRFIAPRCRCQLASRRRKRAGSFFAVASQMPES